MEWIEQLCDDLVEGKTHWKTNLEGKGVYSNAKKLLKNLTSKLIR